MSFFKDLNESLLNKEGSKLNEGEVAKLNEGVKKDPKEDPKEDDAKLDEGESLLTESVTYSICNECSALMENADGGCPACNEGVLEEAVKLIVKDGKVTKKQIKRKKRLTSKQKQALAKARKKAHSGSANKLRAKSMKVRRKRIKESEEFACPECDYVGEMDYDSDEDCYICPECGAELEIDSDDTSDVSEAGCASKGKGKSKKVNESLDMYREILELPESILNEGDNALISYLKEEFGISIED